MEHGGDVYTEGILKGKELLDYSSNINPLGLPESFKSNIGEALESVTRYPDAKYRSLKKDLKDYLQFSKNYFKLESKDAKLKENLSEDSSINEDDILLGNGAAEIIDLTISCFKSICIIIPSFIEYESNAFKWGCRVEYSPLEGDMIYNYEDIAIKIKSVDALIIGNPNNPNGDIIQKDKFKAILDYCEKNGKTIIIDEAFIEFTGKRGFSFLKEVEEYKCIFIIRAVTKFYAMPGIRMGYGISKNKYLIDKIKNKQNPWNVNCFAEIAVKYALKDINYIEQSLNWIERERKFMLKKLKKVKIIDKIYKTYSDFLLCKIKYIDCNKLYDLCLEQGIIIRKCNNFNGLDENYVRLAIKDRSSNVRIIEVLNQIVIMGE